MRRRIFFSIFLAALLALPVGASAATLSLSPASGTFSVGSTFDVSVILGTNGKSVNATSVSLAFPPDMLQVVSPSLGQSVIGVWTAAPRFDNTNGRLELQGGIPGGITASNALISTITFRVKSVGQAIVKFLDGSKVLLNDGLGTNALSQTGNAIYQLRLPPPAGPTLASATNPDQSQWYRNRSVSFQFSGDAANVQGYSYTLSDDPTTIPDDINQGLKNSVTYTDLSDGIHFFHIKARRDGAWGGTTHYSIKIDGTPPADFGINISPSSHTSEKSPIVQFSTTDALSGVDHFEIKTIPLSSATRPETLFTEVVSPYVMPELDNGDYDIIIRAFDKAGNMREVTQRLTVTNSVFSFVGNSGLIFGNSTLPWVWVFAILSVLIGLAAYAGYKMHHWHKEAHQAHKEKQLPDDIARQLKELKQYKAKYGNKALMIVFGLAALLCLHSVSAATGERALLAPPYISTISKNISNEDIFYLGGKTDTGNETVFIYLQNLDSGATLTENTQSDASGDWFYRHSGLLPAGTYRIWTQGKAGDELSPPGPQSQMEVTRTAFQFGGNRFSYGAVYLFIIIILLAALIGLIIFIAYHYVHGKKKKKLLKVHVTAAEESIRRGFALLKRDIEEELSLAKSYMISNSPSGDYMEKEARLRSDLESVQKHLGHDVLEIGNETERREL